MERGRPWQGLVATALLVALWSVAIAGLSQVFAPGGLGGWAVIALLIAAVVHVAVHAAVYPAALLDAARSTPHTEKRAKLPGIAIGATAGLVVWLVSFFMRGRLRPWVRSPGEELKSVWFRIETGVAPLPVDGALQDLLLMAVLLAATVTVYMFARGWRVAAGVVVGLFVFAPVVVTGLRLSPASLIVTGLLLALLVWVGSPRPRPAGLIASGLLVAVTAGVMQVVPDMRDKTWNAAVLLGPVSTSVPDVTLALAEDLRERSTMVAFEVAGMQPGSQRFTLATLVDFEGGVWKPQSEFNAAGLTVNEKWLAGGIDPSPDREGISPLAPNATITIRGLRSTWLPLPSLTSMVKGAGGFDAGEWKWIEGSPAARSDTSITRQDDQFRVATTPLVSSAMLTNMDPHFVVRNLSDLRLPEGSTKQYVGDQLSLEQLLVEHLSAGLFSDERFLAEGYSAEGYSVESLDGALPEAGQSGSTWLRVLPSDAAPSDEGLSDLALFDAAPPDLDLSEPSEPSEPSELPDGEVVPPEDLAPFLALPGGMPHQVLLAIEQVTGFTGNIDGSDGGSGGGSLTAPLPVLDRIEVASNLQEFFTSGEFRYDEAAPYAPGADPDDPYAVMSAFMEQRSGFCVHYAATFAVMARQAGVPTRLSIGYAANSRASDRIFEVRGTDLHVWPEIFIDGLGWIAFEPTPGGAGFRADNDIDLEEEEAAQEVVAEPEVAETETAPLTDPNAVEVAEEAQVEAGDTAEEASVVWIVALAGIGVLLLLAVPAIVRAARRARAVSTAQYAWGEVVDLAVDLGFYSKETPLRARTPAALVEHLVARDAQEQPAGQVGEFAAALRLLAARMEEERYAAAPASCGEADTGSTVDSGVGVDNTAEIAQTLTLVTRTLQQRSSRGQRVAAAVLPRSVLTRKQF